MFMEHLPDRTVIGHKGRRILPEGFFLQDWPVFQVFPRSAIALSTTCCPLCTIIRHTCHSAMQNIAQPLFLPGLESLGAPAFSLECLCDQPFTLGTVAPRAQVKPTQTCSNRTRRGRQTVVE